MISRSDHSHLLRRAHFHPQESYGTHSGQRETSMQTTGHRGEEGITCTCSFTIKVFLSSIPHPIV